MCVLLSALLICVHLAKGVPVSSGSSLPQIWMRLPQHKRDVDGAEAIIITKMKHEWHNEEEYSMLSLPGTGPLNDLEITLNTWKEREAVIIITRLLFCDI